MREKGKKMSEENSLIYCSECGSGNPSTFKYCSNCGTRLQQAKEFAYGQSIQEEQPVSFEKVDAEVVSEGKIPVTQEEININYDRNEEEGVFSSETFSSSNQDYYSSSSTGSAMNANETNGNIGFSIASMVCGIMSILCCCLRSCCAKDICFVGFRSQTTFRHWHYIKGYLDFKLQLYFIVFTVFVR